MLIIGIRFAYTYNKRNQGLDNKGDRMIKKLFLLFCILFTMNLYAAEEVFQLEQINTTIPDGKKLVFPIGESSISFVKSMQLEITIKHDYKSDLMIYLVDPNDNAVLLFDREGNSDNDVDLYVTSLDSLFDTVGTDARGEWRLEVYDMAKYDEGTLESIFFIIDGDQEAGEPQDPVDEDDQDQDDEPVVVEPTPPAGDLSGSCSEKWDAILADSDLEPKYRSLVGLCDDQFKSELKRVISTNRDLGYKGARKVMFSSLDNFDGVVCSVYTDDCLATSGIPNSNVMNCEHTWPQSKGASGIAKSDLHHLYPTQSRANSIRSNLPFCEVEEVLNQTDDSAAGFSQYGTKCYEPRDNHKGNVARSMFYFAVRYGYNLDHEQEEFFRSWTESDQVDQLERERTSDIEDEQGNRNPFVDHPEFIYLLADI